MGGMTWARMRLQVSLLYPRPLFVLHPFRLAVSKQRYCHLHEALRPAQTSLLAHNSTLLLLPPYCSLLQAAEALDPREGRWQALPPAPLARSSFGIATLHDCVYAVGGNIGTEVLNDVSLRGRWGMLALPLLSQAPQVAAVLCRRLKLACAGLSKAGNMHFTAHCVFPGPCRVRCGWRHSFRLLAAGAHAAPSAMAAAAWALHPCNSGAAHASSEACLRCRPPPV